MPLPTPTGPMPFWRLLLRGWGWLIVIAVPVVLILGGKVVHTGYASLRLALDGGVAEAWVTSKTLRDPDGDSRTENDRRIHRLAYRFSVDGIEHTGAATVSRAFWSAAPRDTPLPLRYVRSAPRINEIEPGAIASDLRWSAMGLVLVLLVVGPVWRRRWRIASDMVWVRDHGEARPATVIDHVSTGIQVNDRSTYRLVWKDENGATGRTSLVGKPMLTHFPVGSEITLYFDPVDGRPPVWQAEVGAPRHG